MIDKRNNLTGEKQGAYYLAREQNLSINDVAEKCGVSYLHMRSALYGTARPKPEVLERLPGVLGAPVEALFDSRSRAVAYNPAKRRNTAPGRKAVSAGAV